MMVILTRLSNVECRGRPCALANHSGGLDPRRQSHQDHGLTPPAFARASTAASAMRDDVVAGGVGAWYASRVKFIVRWLFRLLLLTLVLSLGLLLLKDTLLKEWAEARIRRRTGLEAQIGRLEVNLLSPTINVEGLKLFNPPEFGGSPLIEVPDGQVEYDRAALRQGRLHLRLLRLRVAELTVVRNARGASNLQTVQQMIAARRATEESALEFDGIETLNLTFEQVRVQQLGSAAPPQIFHLGLRNEVLTNLRTSQEVNRALLLLAARLGLSALLPAVPVPGGARPGS